MWPMPQEQHLSFHLLALHLSVEYETVHVHCTLASTASYYYSVTVLTSCLSKLSRTIISTFFFSYFEIRLFFLALIPFFTPPPQPPFLILGFFTHHPHLPSFPSGTKLIAALTQPATATLYVTCLSPLSIYKTRSTPH